jgi:hypothetical protein
MLYGAYPCDVIVGMFSNTDCAHRTLPFDDNRNQSITGFILRFFFYYHVITITF